MTQGPCRGSYRIFSLGGGLQSLALTWRAYFSTPSLVITTIVTCCSRAVGTGPVWPDNSLAFQKIELR